MPKSARDHWVEIRREGPTVAFRKVKYVVRISAKALLIASSAFWALPLALLIRLARPIVIIRIGPIHAHRIGHFVPDSVALVLAARVRPPKQWDLYYLLPRRTANLQWERMVRRELSMSGWWLNYVDIWNRRLPCSSLHHRPNSANTSRDPNGLFRQGLAPIDFLEDENLRALEWLKSLGWTEGEPFVCLQVRDNEYLARDPRFGRGDQQSFDNWDYHSYRNSQISTYAASVQWLLDQGVWVFRMGRIMREEIPLSHPHLVDYAFRDDTSDFLDIWLFANCSGTISTSSGPDWVSAVYGKPLLIINFLPLQYAWSYSNCLHVPKNLYWRQGHMPLTLSEYLAIPMTDFQVGTSNVEIEDLDPASILEGVREFWARNIGNWIPASEDADLQSRFWSAFESWAGYPSLHGWRNDKAGIGALWLRSRTRRFFES